MQIKPVFLPKTSFQIRANLSSKEPLILQNWEIENLYKVIREKAKKYPKFILQDGPPFANGKPHMGTAFNRIIKDIILRFKQMQGYDAPFIPGWDCHGLPIEWKVFENNKGENLSITEFREKCKEFALKWIDIQRSVFKRLGTLADWNNPYITMDPKSEAKIVENIFHMLKTGALYKDSRPVMWSVVEKTALAEAEVEYHDKKSTSIYVAFHVKSTDVDFLNDSEIVIWTTTPWTIPCNRAISYSSKIEYVLIEISDTESNKSRKVAVAKDLLNSFLSAINVENDSFKIVREFSGCILKNTICSHPLFEFGYDFDVPLLDGSHVTTESGTGFVHTAPSHGLDDFYISKEHGINADLTVSEDGTYENIVPLFAGMHIFKAEDAILEKLSEVKSLLAKKEIVHSYPHSWRSKAPLIYRATSQWFISLDRTGIRDKALSAIETVNWLPEKGKNRISSFVKNRKDWCISRQRTWGIPLSFFVNKKTGEPLIDDAVFQKTIDEIRENGTNSWYAKDASTFLTEKYSADDYEKITDIIDVWIESGSVFSYVTMSRQELTFPADLYLEGSDQHRGWFQSSLLISCATTGIAPYKSVLTHGFIVDENGLKMSKSIGNTIDPEDIIKDSGADILRIWAINNDYTEDMRIGPNIIEQQKDLYKKFRNIFKYLLGALDGFSDAEKITFNEMTQLDKYILARLQQINEEIYENLKNFNIKNIFISLKNFCLKDLSSFYFDVRKDILYCDPIDSLKRRSYRTVIDILFKTLIKWFAPILVFTTEEAWRIRFAGELFPKNDPTAKSERFISVHTELFEELDNSVKNPAIIEKFNKIFNIRSVILNKLEEARQNKTIASNLDAEITIAASAELLQKLNIKTLDEILTEKELEEFTITSRAHIIDASCVDESFALSQDLFVKVEKAKGEKCQRCWKIFEKLDDSCVCSRCK